MRSIIVHGMGNELAAHLEREARDGGLSLSELIKRLLAKALGLGSARSERRKEFERFCGLWSVKEAAAFHEATRGFKRVERKGQI